MFELDWEHVVGLAESATGGGWSGLAALILAILASIGLVFKKLRTSKEDVQEANEARRVEDQVQNAKANQTVEKQHASAEKEIEALLKKELDDAR